MFPNNWKNLSKEEKVKFIIDESRKILCVQKDLSVNNLVNIGVTPRIIRSLFGNFQNLRIKLGLSTNQRLKNLSNLEIKKIIEDFKKIGDLNCPAKNKTIDPCCEKCNCWVTGKKYKSYRRPQLKYKGKMYFLSRLVYKLFKGDLLSDKVVAHSCDNHLCFNPDHLFLKTQLENMQEASERKRLRFNSKKRANILIKDPYDYENLLIWIKSQVIVSDKNEWLWQNIVTKAGYISVSINKTQYLLHRLVLANKLKIKYEEVDVARHVLPNGDEGQKHDLNPDHLQNGTRSDNSNDRKKEWAISKENFNLIKEKLSTTSFEEKGQSSTFDLKYSKLLNVSKEVIRQIRVGKHYKIFGNIEKKGSISKPVYQISNIDETLIKKFPSVKEVAQWLNIDARRISDMCLGKIKQNFNNFYLSYKISSND